MSMYVLLDALHGMQEPLQGLLHNLCGRSAKASPWGFELDLPQPQMYCMLQG